MTMMVIMMMMMIGVSRKMITVIEVRYVVSNVITGMPKS